MEHDFPFSPGNNDESFFENSFTLHKDFESEILRINPVGGILAHIIGERGAGKTTLLNKIYYKIKNGNYISSPLIFPEELSNVIDLNSLFQTILLQINEQYPNRHLHCMAFEDKKNVLIQSSNKKRIKELDFKTFFYDVFLDCLERDNLRITVFIDNFQSLLEKLFKYNEEFLFFQTTVLKNERIGWIVATPLLNKDTENKIGYILSNIPQFRLKPLDSSSEEDISNLKDLLRFHIKDVAIKKNIENENNLKAIIDLAGGNLRGMLYLVEIIDNINNGSYKQFQKLLDTLTPFFRERLEETGSVKTAIVYNIGLSVEGYTLAELIKTTGLRGFKTNEISSYCEQLVNDGILKKISVEKMPNRFVMRDLFFQYWIKFRSKKDGLKTITWFIDLVFSFIGLEKGISWLKNAELPNEIKEDLGKFSEYREYINQNFINTPVVVQENGGVVKSNDSEISSKPIKETIVSLFSTHKQILNQNGINDKRLLSLLMESNLRLIDKEKIFTQLQSMDSEKYFNLKKALEKLYDETSNLAKGKYSNLQEDIHEYLALACFHAEITGNAELSEYFIDKYVEEEGIKGQFFNTIQTQYGHVAFQKLLSIVPESKRGVLYTKMKNYNIKLGFIMEADLLIKKKKFQEASDLLFEYSKKQISPEEETQIFNRLAWLAIQLRNFKEAKIYYENAKNYQSLVWLLATHEKLELGSDTEDIDENVGKIKNTIEKHIEYEPSLKEEEEHYLGVLYFRIYQQTNNIKYYELGKLNYENNTKNSLSKNRAGSGNNLAWALFVYRNLKQKAKDDINEAIEFAEDSLLLQPESTATKHTLATLYLWRGDINKSLNLASSFLYDSELIEDSHDFGLYLILLISRKEFDILNDFFNSSRGINLQTKERFSAMYYTFLFQKGDIEGYNRAPELLKSTIASIKETVVIFENEFLIQ